MKVPAKQESSLYSYILQETIMTEETCDICQSEMDLYGCLGAWTGVHEAAVAKLHEEAMTASVEAIEDLQNYCYDRGLPIPTDLHRQVTNASTLMRNCLGLGGENESPAITFEPDEDFS